jgi:hypothetical protein
LENSMKIISMKNLIRLRTAAVLLTTLFGILSCAAEPKTTALGHSIHTVPIAEKWFSNIMWLDDNRLIYLVANRQKQDAEATLLTRIWDVERHEVVAELRNRRPECVERGEGEPAILLSSNERLPEPVRTDGRKAWYASKHYLWRADQEQRIPAEEVGSIPQRQYTLKSGQTVTQRFRARTANGCLGQWWPNDATPAVVLAVAQAQDAFVGRVGEQEYLMAGKNSADLATSDTNPVQLILSSHPIDLPVRYCEIGHNASFYFSYARRASYALATAIYDPLSGKCRYLNQDEPLRLWWLYPDGRMELTALPPVDHGLIAPMPDNASADKKTIPMAIVASGTHDIVPTRIGVLKIQGRLTRKLPGSESTLYIAQNEQWVKLYAAPNISVARVSPSGCRVALEEDNGYADLDYKTMALRVIDLCPMASAIH